MSARTSADRTGDETRSLRRRVPEVVDAAYAAFWSHVAAAFPEITAGDLPPEADHRLTSVLLAVVDLWVSENAALRRTGDDDVITAVRIEVRMGRATAFVMCGADRPMRLCSWFIDEHSFGDADFIGRTPAEFRQHFHRLDVAFVQS